MLYTSPEECCVGTEPDLGSAGGNKIYMLFESTQDDLLPGHVMAIDMTEKTGRHVTLAGAGHDARVVGVFTGIGGSVPTTSLASEYAGTTDGADGDFIWLQVYGPAYVAMKGSSISIGDPMQCVASGVLDAASDAAHADGVAGFAVSLAADTSDTEVIKLAYLRCM
jgi:hypothetical protein